MIQFEILTEISITNSRPKQLGTLIPIVEK